MRPRLLGLLCIPLVLALDQGAKLWVIRSFADASLAPQALAPFIDLRLSWNQGISFSIFAGSDAATRMALLAFALIAVVVLSFWLARAARLAPALGLGMIIGGALGNAYDRFRYGAVADFLDLHWGVRHFFVFNLADAAINLGVALLLIDALFSGSQRDAAGP